MSGRMANLLNRPDVWLIALALATALGLYWLIRGAPPGQAADEEGRGQEAPTPGRRDRLVLGVVAGFVLIVAGAVVAVEFGVPWSVPVFGAGFAAVLVAGRACRAHRHSSPILRRAARFAEAGLTASLLAGVLVVGNVLAFRYADRPIDLTREKVHSLETLSLQAVRSLDRPLRFTAFYGNDRDRRSRKQFERVWQLLELYRQANPARVNAMVVRPFSEPIETQALLERAPGLAVTPGGGVLVEYGEGASAERLIVSHAEMFESDPLAAIRPGGTPATATTFRGEDALTSALLRLREGKKTRAAFITGHGELSVHESAPNRPGAGLLRARLESVGVEVAVLNLLADRLSAKDVQVAIIAAPKTPYQPQEVQRLKDYTGTGGKLVLMLDGRSKTGLEDWLAEVDVAIDPGPIADAQLNFRRSAFWPLAPIVGDSDHPIVEPLRNQYPVVPEASPLRIGRDVTERRPSGRQRSEFATALLHTGPRSWVESDPLARPIARDPSEKGGPFVVGAAVAVAPAESAQVGQGMPVMVVFGTPLLGDNRVVASSPPNLDVLLNSIYWLRGRPELQGLSPRVHKALVLSADPGLRGRLILLPTVLAVALIVGLGLATYLARRS